MPTQMTIAEAARHLGVTRRTIERRLQKGDLVASRVNGKRYVLINDISTTHDGRIQPSRTTQSDNMAQTERLKAELEAIRSERDYLRQHVSQLTATLYQLNNERALSPQATEKPTERRNWWAFWRRTTHAETLNTR